MELIVPKYLTVKRFAAEYNFITEGGLRHLIFSNAIFNDKCVKRVGKKILLDVEAVFEFIANGQNMRSAI